MPSDINSFSQRLTSVAAMEGTDGEETRESDNAAVQQRCFLGLRWCRQHSRCPLPCSLRCGSFSRVVCAVGVRAPAASLPRHSPKSSLRANESDDNDSVTIEISNNSSGGYSDDDGGYRDEDYADEVEDNLLHSASGPSLYDQLEPRGVAPAPNPTGPVPVLAYPQGEAAAPSTGDTKEGPRETEVGGGEGEEKLMREIERLREENKMLRADSMVERGQLVELRREKEKQEKLLKRYKGLIQAVNEELADVHKEMLVLKAQNEQLQIQLADARSL